MANTWPPVSSSFEFRFLKTDRPNVGVQLNEVQLFGAEGRLLPIINATNPFGYFLNSEGPSNVVDGVLDGPNSKWLDLSMVEPGVVSTLLLELAAPAIVFSYTLTTASHAFGRNPNTWELSTYPDKILIDRLQGGVSPLGGTIPYHTTTFTIDYVRSPPPSLPPSTPPPVLPPRPLGLRPDAPPFVATPPSPLPLIDREFNSPRLCWSGALVSSLSESSNQQNCSVASPTENRCLIEFGCGCSFARENEYDPWYAIGCDLSATCELATVASPDTYACCFETLCLPPPLPPTPTNPSPSAPPRVPAGTPDRPPPPLPDPPSPLLPPGTPGAAFRVLTVVALVTVEEAVDAIAVSSNLAAAFAIPADDVEVTVAPLPTSVGQPASGDFVSTSSQITTNGTGRELSDWNDATGELDSYPNPNSTPSQRALQQAAQTDYGVSILARTGPANSATAQQGQQSLLDFFAECEETPAQCTSTFGADVLAIEYSASQQLLPTPSPPRPPPPSPTPKDTVSTAEVLLIVLCALAGLLAILLAVWFCVGVHLFYKQKRETLVNGLTLDPPVCPWLTRSKDGFACFISHSKMHDGADARYLHDLLHRVLRAKIFLDSTDLIDPRMLPEQVQHSDVLVLLGTDGALARPKCLLELYLAQKHGVPVLLLLIDSARNSFDPSAACRFLCNLEEELPKRNPNAIPEIESFLRRTNERITLREFRDCLIEALLTQLGTPRQPQHMYFRPWGSDCNIMSDLKELIDAMATASTQDTVVLKLPAKLTPNQEFKQYMRLYTRRTLPYLGLRPRRKTSPDLDPNIIPGYAFYISCYRAEAGCEARLVQAVLLRQLKPRRIYLDGTDYEPVRKLLRYGVLKAHAVLLVATRSALMQPKNLLELYTAVRQNIPIVPLIVENSGYDVEQARNLLTNLASSLDEHNPGALSRLREMLAARIVPGVPSNRPAPTVEDVQHALCTTLPFLAPLHYDPSRSPSHLDAVVQDILKTARRRLSSCREQSGQATIAMASKKVNDSAVSSMMSHAAAGATRMSPCCITRDVGSAPENLAPGGGLLTACAPPYPLTPIPQSEGGSSRRLNTKKSGKRLWVLGAIPLLTTSWFKRRSEPTKTSSRRGGSSRNASTKSLQPNRAHSAYCVERRPFVPLSRLSSASRMNSVSSSLSTLSSKSPVPRITAEASASCSRSIGLAPVDSELTVPFAMETTQEEPYAEQAACAEQAVYTDEDDGEGYPEQDNMEAGCSGSPRDEEGEELGEMTHVPIVHGSAAFAMLPAMPRSSETASSFEQSELSERHRYHAPMHKPVEAAILHRM